MSLNWSQFRAQAVKWYRKDHQRNNPFADIADNTSQLLSEVADRLREVERLTTERYRAIPERMISETSDTRLVLSVDCRVSDRTLQTLNCGKRQQEEESIRQKQIIGQNGPNFRCNDYIIGL